MTTERNLEGIMLSETSQTKINTAWHSLYAECKNQVKKQSAEWWLPGAGTWVTGYVG